MGEARKAYVVTYNRDYEESAFAFPTRAKAVAHIAETFKTTKKCDTPRFWEEVIEAYEVGNWKGFAFYTLDLDTLVMREVEHG